MKKLLAIVVLTGCHAVPSFAGDVAGQSVKVAGEDTAKAVAAVGKFLF
jgi:hypothetical protein